MSATREGGPARSGRRADVVQLAGELFAQKGYRSQPRFGYVRKAVGEIERTWVTQLERGKQEGIFRADLDARLTYRLLRDVLWIPSQWRLAEGYSIEEVAEGLLRLLFDGITA